jgi:NADPH:quinone reductase-like Zn-dependent oxidoreductase
MRAIRFHQFGPPKEVLILEEMPQPSPGPGQVLVRLTHRPINPSDLYTVRGTYGHLPSLPASPGFEGMGRIEALGEGVRSWHIGDRVIPLSGDGGTWREYALVDAGRLLPVLPSVTDQTAAQFIVNPVTTWVMLVEELQVQPGEWVLQTAAGSTLGQIVIQLGRLRGFKTVNLVRRREQIDELLALGADAVFSTDEPGLTDKVKALTGRNGPRVALDAVGGETGALALGCLRPGGTMLLYGMLSGESLPVHSGEMLFRGLTLRGFWLSHWFRQQPPDRVSTTLMNLMQIMGEGHLIPPVEAEYELADFVTAIAHAERPGRRGKILLVG